MSPLEKAARALYEFGMMADCPTWDQFDERYKRDFFDMARAVLLAVREPSDEMLKAGYVAMRNTPGRTWKKMKNRAATPQELFDAKHRPRFTAMIDAILEGE